MVLLYSRKILVFFLRRMILIGWLNGNETFILNVYLSYLLPFWKITFWVDGFRYNYFRHSWVFSWLEVFELTKLNRFSEKSGIFYQLILYKNRTVYNYFTCCVVSIKNVAINEIRKWLIQLTENFTIRPIKDQTLVDSCSTPGAVSKINGQTPANTDNLKKSAFL